MPKLWNGSKGGSRTPGCLDCESGILSLSYRAPHKRSTQLQSHKITVKISYEESSHYASCKDNVSLDNTFKKQQCVIALTRTKRVVCELLKQKAKQDLKVSHLEKLNTKNFKVWDRRRRRWILTQNRPYKNTCNHGNQSSRECNYRKKTWYNCKEKTGSGDSSKTNKVAIEETLIKICSDIWHNYVGISIYPS